MKISACSFWVNWFYQGYCGGFSSSLRKDSIHSIHATDNVYVNINLNKF